MSHREECSHSTYFAQLMAGWCRESRDSALAVYAFRLDSIIEIVEWNRGKDHGSIKFNT